MFRLSLYMWGTARHGLSGRIYDITRATRVARAGDDTTEIQQSTVGGSQAVYGNLV